MVCALPYDQGMAYTRKLPSGKFEGIAKDGRVRLGSRTFRLQRDAQAWAERLETAAAGGLDVRAGKATVKTLLPVWLEHRSHTVSANTVRADRHMSKAVTPSLKARAVSSIKRQDIVSWLQTLRRNGLSYGTVARHRASLAAFFSWLVEDHRITANPVKDAKQPPKVAEQVEMKPFTETELSQLVTTLAQTDQRIADIIQVLGWTGLRWGESRALKVSDIRLGDNGTPTHIRVSRSQSEGREVKGTKGRSARTVPVVAVAQPALARLIDGKNPGDLALPSERGGQLWRGRFRKQARWAELAGGRRPHDLRHSAATLWLSNGVDLSTVSAWLGHSSTVITNGYLHYAGTSADDAAVAKINAATTGRRPED